MKKQLLLQLAVLFIVTLSLSKRASAQTSWVETWQQSNNFHSIQKAFNDQCKEELKEEKQPDAAGEPNDEAGLFPGYTQFLRWQNYVAPRVYPSGDLSLLSTTWKNYEKFLEENNMDENNNGDRNSTWQAMGPFGALSGNATNGLPRKAGRINFITYTANINTFWVGAADGNLWKTTDHGVSWTSMNESMSVIGCTDLAIDPTNPQVMYLATGDGYGSFRNPSTIGVWKSIDGGVTWAATGLVIPIFPKVEMRKIIINPVNTQIVMAATSSGIYRTTNGGTAWTNVQPTNTYDLEFKPSNPDTVYASGIRFRRSTDAGLTWVQINSGIPVSGSQRMETATTPANPNLVYVVSTTNTTFGLQGVYRSTDGGTTFSTMATTPDIIASDCFITSTSGQGFYDLAIDASPLNQNEVVVGGLGVWRSTNGGTNWSCIGCAYNWSSSVPYIHTDHQELEYTTAGVLFSVNDGGVYEYTGTAWTDITNPMNIAQIYKIGLSSQSANLWITGHQDNGTNIYNNGNYMASLAADGTDNFIDRTNDLTMYAEISQGQFYKSTDGGAHWAVCTTGVANIGGFISPWKQDPQVSSTLYAGKDQIYRTINSAGSWTVTPGFMTPVISTEYVTEFAIAPSNNQYIYAIHGTTGVFTTQNAAATNWVLSNTGLPVSSASASFITVSPTNPLIAWVTFSGYQAGKKVYKTTDGGLHWQNISYNLPNLPANCSVFEPGNANDRIYVGMDVGVYFKDSAATTWTLYNSGLPNASVMDMEISPAAPTLIRAATFGRGVYQVSIAPNPVPPVSAYTYSGNLCNDSSIVFHDNSSNSPTSWLWSVNPSGGVTINTPTSQNPTITFTNSGNYTVSLTATNGFGTGNQSTQNITISTVTVNASANPTTVCQGQATTLSATGATTYSWQPGNLSGASVNFVPSSTQTYTVTGTNATGCSATDTVTVTVINCTGIIPLNGSSFTFYVFPNPTNNDVRIHINVKEETDFVLEVTDETGKIILKNSASFTSNIQEQELNLSSLAAGVYFLKIKSAEGNSQPVKIIKQ